MLTAGDARDRNKKQARWFVAVRVSSRWYQKSARDLRACASWLLEENGEGHWFQFQGNNYK